MKGEKSRVWDMDGNEHLDLFCSYGCMIVGHGNAAYTEPLKQCLDWFNGNAISGLEEPVCGALVNQIPCADMVRFGLSGSECVQNCIRLARAYTGKNRFIRFTGHYHGQADNILGGRYGDKNYPVPEQFRGDFLGTQGRAVNAMEEQSFLIPWNDFDLLRETVEQHAGEVAAVIMEPINMNTAAILPREDYLRQVRALCSRHNIVLIFDEVLTTVRVGPGGAQGYFGVTPDLAIFGKAISGGSFPITAFMGRKEIMQLYSDKKVVHGGSYNGYPLGLQAILTTQQLLTEGAYQQMNAALRKMARAFQDAFAREGLPLRVQHMPGAFSFHLRTTPIQVFEDYRSEQRALDYIFTKVASFNGIQFAPSSRVYGNIQLSDADVDFFADRLARIIPLAKKDATFKAMLRVCRI